MELMCEGLGVNPQRLKEMSCLEGRLMVAHYYPYCQEPDQTIGLASHTDPGVLTVLLQDQVGGLQVLYEGEWLDVKPVPGALVINIGDILQIISNDENKSGEHRVLANPFQTPQVSIVVFLNPSNRDGLFGPLPELVSPEKLALYRKFTFEDFMKRFFTKELDGDDVTCDWNVKRTIKGTDCNSDPFASQAKRKKCSVSEKSELYQYFKEPKKPWIKDYDVLTYLKQCESQLPDMARMALPDNGVCRTSELLLLISR